MKEGTKDREKCDLTHWRGKLGDGRFSFEVRRAGYREKEFRLLNLKCMRFSGKILELGREVRTAEVISI